MVWRPYRNERVRLVGGQVLSTWQPHEGAILKTDTKRFADTDAAFKQLFAQGRRMDLAFVVPAVIGVGCLRRRRRRDR